MNYIETISYPLDANGNPASNWDTVSSGANQGLDAEIIPMSMQVIATRPAGASVNMTRKVEVALIPVFQFGVFCGFDCSYFPGPNFGFGGRVHTNGNLFLAAGADLVFNDKIAAFQQIVTDRLENGFIHRRDIRWNDFCSQGKRRLRPGLSTLRIELRGSSGSRHSSRRRQLERRISWHCGHRQQQFSQHFFRDLQWIPGEFVDRRHQYAAAVCAKQLHQQPAALHRSDRHRAQAAAR